VVHGLFAPLIAAIDPSESGKDPKTQLQEILQARRLPLPEYRLVNTSAMPTTRIRRRLRAGSPQAHDARPARAAVRPNRKLRAQPCARLQK
jgi:hypothetical protein